MAKNPRRTGAAKVKVVEAVGIASGRSALFSGAARKNEFSNLIEQAMVKAVEKAQEEGITDADEIRARTHQARDEAREEISSRIAKMAEEASKPQE